MKNIVSIALFMLFCSAKMVAQNSVIEDQTLTSPSPKQETTVVNSHINGPDLTLQHKDASGSVNNIPSQAVIAEDLTLKAPANTGKSSIEATKAIKPEEQQK